MDKLIKQQRKGLWIDNDIINSSLTAHEMLILSDIIAICKNNNNIYIKLNSTIADMWNISIRTVNNVMKSLKDKELIFIRNTTYADSFKKKRTILPNWVKIYEL